MFTDGSTAQRRNIIFSSAALRIDFRLKILRKIYIGKRRYKNREAESIVTAGDK